MKQIENARDIDTEEEERIEIPDPLEPFNRVMFTFNDKLYFFVLKPIAQGYSKVLPEKVRVCVKNFFSNILFPVRLVNCFLQGNAEGVAAELARFTANTVFGLGGVIDFASREDINIPKCDEDFGQTLGSYGLGPGFYINWPFLGPSSPRDTVGWIGDSLLYPFQYVKPWYVSITTKVYDKVNDTSLRIGDYEALKEAAVDPYVAVRDAYAQYRYQKIKEKIIKNQMQIREGYAP
ncbi:MAG: VacJ family lipoprotein [Syntrophales bacterium]|nr:VacJ family lipoprotein [Syntrophales bacterium]